LLDKGAIGNNRICSLSRALLWPSHWAQFISYATGIEAQEIYEYSLHFDCTQPATRETFPSSAANSVTNYIQKHYRKMTVVFFNDTHRWYTPDSRLRFHKFHWLIYFYFFIYFIYYACFWTYYSIT